MSNGKTISTRMHHGGRPRRARRRVVIVRAAVVAASLLVTGTAAAQPAHHQLPELANCSLYRSKKERIPVYGERTTGAPVVDRLSLGEEVCYIGEDKEFAILDWSKQPLLRRYQVLKPLTPAQGERREDPAAYGEPAGTASPALGDEPQANRAYVRLVDLWEPRYPRHIEPESWLSQLWSNFWSGGVIDDPFASFRPDTASDVPAPAGTPAAAPASPPPPRSATDEPSPGVPVSDPSPDPARSVSPST